MKTIFDWFKRNLYVVLFLVLEVFSIGLYLRYHQQEEARFLDFCTGVRGRFASVFGDRKSRESLRRENARLQEENAWLRACMENSYFRTSHVVDSVSGDSLYRQMYVYAEAHVLDATTRMPDNYLLLDIGAKEGIEPGMAVLSPKGIVGVVDKVSPYFSSVISVLHSQSLVSVSLASSGYSGSLSWPGVKPDEGLLSDVPSHVKVRIGERVVTSGLSLVYPGGIPVGFVSEVISGEGEDFYQLKLRFSEDYACIDKVYVVKNLYKEELESCKRTSGRI